MVFKRSMQALLQNSLGFQRYLYLLARFNLFTMRYSRRERDFMLFMSMLPNDGIVLDIGANIGVMTVPLGKKCSHGKIYAFEPVPENYSTLQKVCRASGADNVELFQLALGDKNKMVKMVMPERHYARQQGLSHVCRKNNSDINEIQSYNVRQITLDSMSDIFSMGITAIKIDVENYEYHVFKGALQLLKKYRPLVFAELWYSSNRKQCFDLFRSIPGYRIKVWEKRNLVEYIPGHHKRQDFFFVPEHWPVN